MRTWTALWRRFSRLLEAEAPSHAAKTVDQPLLRIRPTGIGNGASDPGGWAWVWAPILTIAVVAVIVTLLR